MNKLIYIYSYDIEDLIHKYHSYALYVYKERIVFFRTDHVFVIVWS